MGAKKGEDLEPVGSIRSSDSHRLHSLKETVSLAARDREEEAPAFCAFQSIAANVLLKCS